MGQHGPIPNRSDQRVRRNTPDSPVDTITAIGPVSIPPLGIPDCHPLVSDLYESMKKSAQTRYYEESDWAYARVTLHFLNKLVWSSKPSSQMLASINSMLTSLLLTEGDRRRVRIEVERQLSGSDATVTPISELFRKRLEQA